MANLVETLNNKTRHYNLPSYVKVIDDQVVIDSEGYYSNHDLIMHMKDAMDIIDMSTDEALLYLEARHEARMQIEKEDKERFRKAIKNVIVISSVVILLFVALMLVLK